jgi:hypothetical protein
MNDLSHIGRPGANEERRIASARRRICHCCSALLNGREERKIISGPGGPRKSLKRLKTDKGNPRKTGPLSWIVFARAWPDFAEFGFGLDRAWPNFNMHNTESAMPIAAANATANAMSARRRGLVRQAWRGPNGGCLLQDGQAIEKAQNGNGQLLEKVGMDLGLAPLPLGFGATSVWGRATSAWGRATRRARGASIGSGEGPAASEQFFRALSSKESVTGITDGPTIFC